MNWTSKPKPQRPKKCTTVGILSQDDDEGVTVHLNVSGPCKDSGIFIPRCNVVKVEELCVTE